MFLNNTLLKSALLALLLALSSCTNVPIAEDLDQTEANHIIAVLAENGIYAVSEKDSTGKPKYVVRVDNSFYTQAKTILVESSLPRDDRPSFTDLIEARGLLPNSREIEKLRIDHALAMEVEEALTSHPAISRVKVIVRNHSVAEGISPAVSVVIEEHTERTLDHSEIRKLVSKMLPGISDDNIVLTVSKANPAADKFSARGAVNQGGKIINIPLTHFLFNWHVPETDYNAMVIVLIVCFFVMVLIGGLLGYWYGYFKHARPVLDNGLPDLTMRSLRLDRPERGPGQEV